MVSVTSKISSILRHYRTVFFWLIVSLGLLLGNDPVIGVVALGALFLSAGLLFAPYHSEEDSFLTTT